MIKNLLLVSLFVMGITACESSDPNPTVEFRFLDSDKASLYASTSDPDLIAKAQAELGRPLDQRRLSINGKISRGDDGHHTGWRWHFVPDEWDLVEMSIELCDGTGAMVEKNLDYWIDKVGRFCPWGSRVVEAIDH